MINIKISRDNKKNVNIFSVKGHAYADEPGKDIVCASVSVLTQTTLLSLYEVANIDINYEISDGWISCTIPENIDIDKRQKANIIIDTMLIGLKGIIEMHSQYVKISDKEV